MSLTDWFLTPAERGNPATDIDRRHDDGTAWTEGNDGQVLVDGADYFARLAPGARASADAGDWVSFTDWQGDPDELLDGPGTEVGDGARRARRPRASTCAGCCGARIRRR